MHRSMTSRPIYSPACHSPRGQPLHAASSTRLLYIMCAIFSTRVQCCSARHTLISPGASRLQRTGTVPNIARLKNNGPVCRRDA